MIIIDGQQSEYAANHFENLEELLDKVTQDEHFQDRIITDVRLNDEIFSEIYPHQAEDIERDELQKVEIVSVSKLEMGRQIVKEMTKVVSLMSQGARQIADLFRQAEDLEALATYQDLLEVARDFLNMVGSLQEELGLSGSKDMDEVLASFSSLLTEMIEVQENEDWVLLADLLEYEFLPVVEKWLPIIHDVDKSLQ
ncbi:hypothetical protein DPF_2651 [Desulfoplanes formicivorans]|uniref:Chemotaxis protein n=2 Tax=Desulfoplanes formicivorans TaxID=1592317 RepID=A0A194AKZ5_9BACT|nr:hypothetical protein [Desulfoplanes formicivorans]GAU09915.1 hypothetical protein DPF_2651 [Desulfoplanes formicivorans]